MRLTFFVLLVVGSFAAPAAVAADSAAPELVRLDQELVSTQKARQGGRISPKYDEEFAARFRADLREAKASAPPSPVNTALYARILARLGEFERADDVLSEALRGDPNDLALRTALSQVRYDEKNYPAALAEADAVLALDPTNKEALVLKHFSAGRVAANGDSSPSSAPSAEPRHSSRRVRFAVADASTLPFKLPVKVVAAAAPPDIVGRDSVPMAPEPGPLPLLPLSGAMVLGLAAYGVARSRSAYESIDGLDDDHLAPVGRYQRLVTGTVLAGAAGALFYMLGAAVVSAAPIALGYAANVGSQGLSLAGSEAGGINAAPAVKMEEMLPEAETVAADAEQTIIRKGEIVNRVWHSEWEDGSEMSGPTGQSYCRGSCLPIHAAHAIERRGLNIEGVVNNARRGSIYFVKEDVVATVRRSVGGIEEELLIRPADVNKLEEVSRSHIPSGLK